MMKNILIMLLSVLSLSACVSAQKCQNNLSSNISFSNFKYKKNDNVSFIVVDEYGKQKSTEYFDGMYFNDKDRFTSIVIKKTMLSGKNTYKLTYNNDVLYIYDFQVSSQKYMPQYCNIEEPKFKINNCATKASLMFINKSCGIPASEAYAYFKKYVQPTMKKPSFWSKF